MQRGHGSVDSKLLAVTKTNRDVLPRRIKFVAAIKAKNKFNPGCTSKKNGRTADEKKDSEAETLPTKKEELFPTQVIEEHLLWKRKHIRAAGAGLRNLGNTCFLNSAVQCLTYSPVLCELLLSEKLHFLNNSNGSMTSFCMLKTMQQHVKRVINSTSSSSSFSPTTIVHNLKAISRRLKFGRQHDAHEFLRLVIDKMQNSCLIYHGLKPNSMDAISMTTLISQLFGGELHSSIKCDKANCNYESVTVDPFLDLSIDVSASKHETLDLALKRFTRYEILDSSNKWRCDGCKQMVCARKQLAIGKLPYLLVIHLKRFSSGFRSRKIDTFVKYNEELNLKPYLASKLPKERCRYSLYAVLVHSGHTTSSGHYYCYIKAGNGIWYQMNDESVSQVGIQTVLRQKAYLLFYSREAVPKAVKSKLQIDKPQHSSTPSPSTSNSNGLKAKPPVVTSPCANGAAANDIASLASQFNDSRDVVQKPKRLAKVNRSLFGHFLDSNPVEQPPMESSLSTAASPRVSRLGKFSRKTFSCFRKQMNSLVLKNLQKRNKMNLLKLRHAATNGKTNGNINGETNGDAAPEGGAVESGSAGYSNGFSKESKVAFAKTEVVTVPRGRRTKSNGFWMESRRDRSGNPRPSAVSNVLTSWDDEPSVQTVAPRRASALAKRPRYDTWDAALDQGKVKKVKLKPDKADSCGGRNSTSNQFQSKQNSRNKAKHRQSEPVKPVVRWDAVTVPNNTLKYNRPLDSATAKRKRASSFDDL